MCCPRAHTRSHVCDRMDLISDRFVRWCRHSNRQTLLKAHKLHSPQQRRWMNEEKKILCKKLKCNETPLTSIHWFRFFAPLKDAKNAHTCDSSSAICHTSWIGFCSFFFFLAFEKRRHSTFRHHHIFVTLLPISIQLDANSLVVWQHWLQIWKFNAEILTNGNPIRIFFIFNQNEHAHWNRNTVHKNELTWLSHLRHLREKEKRKHTHTWDAYFSRHRRRRPFHLFRSCDKRTPSHHKIFFNHKYGRI